MLDIKTKPTISKTKKIEPYSKYGIKCISIGNMVPADAAVIWRGAIASNAVKQLYNDVEWGDLDYLIIDLPPGTGDIQISLCQNISINGAVLISTPQEVSLIDVRKAISMFVKLKIPILGLIQNMSYLDLGDSKDYIFGKNGVLNEAKKQKISFLGELPIIKEIAKSGDSGVPETSNPESRTYPIICKIAEELINICSKIRNINVEIET